MLKFRRVKRESNLQRRFIVRVLAPPFFILLILGVIILFQLDRYVRDQAVNELSRSASTTAAKLEREFALREIILKRTGEELFNIKSDYLSDRTKLDANRIECSAYMKQKKTFTGAPNNSCSPFLAAFAENGSTLIALESSYIKNGQELIADQNRKINERLSAYKQFFPETMAIMVVDKNQQLVSSALSGLSDETTKIFMQDTIAAGSQAINGKFFTGQDKRLGIFAYPIENGSVLAAYDLTSNSFIRQTWQSTPIDRTTSLAVILDSYGRLVYPNVDIGDVFGELNANLRKNSYTELDLKKVRHIAVSGESGKSKWLVVVASPKAAVLGPLHDARLAAVITIGLLLIGFLWVGAIFIQRTVHSILRLVSGALVFAGGKLDYKIRLTHGDREFVSLAETMNTMAGRIAAAEKEIDEKNKEFISVATHELRTPLTAIIGNLSMVYDDMGDKLDPAVRPLIEQVYTSTNRLRDLINDMLDVARMEGGRAEFKVEVVDIREVAGSTVHTLQITAKESGINLIYDNSHADKVMVDKARLGIILNNFVSNAIKYNRPGGSVTISHTQKDNKLVTAIADTGLGIPETQKKHMFEKFFRVDDKDRKDVIGTGLGMYITRQYIIAMDGDVWFESTHGQGTTFYFSLPLALPSEKSVADTPLSGPPI